MYKQKGNITRKSCYDRYSHCLSRPASASSRGPSQSSRPQPATSWPGLPRAKRHPCLGRGYRVGLCPPCARRRPSAWQRLRARAPSACGDIATARIPAGALEAAASLPDVAYVQTAVPVARMMDIVRPAVGADLVQAGSGLPRPFTGRGVVVGIIDAGFDYTHPNFRTPSGELRIRRVWEQGYGGARRPRASATAASWLSPGRYLPPAAMWRRAPTAPMWPALPPGLTAPGGDTSA